MLRATFTKIKRACVIALVPRIVRGDSRYTTRKFGKTSINVLRKAAKSTDSGSKDGDSESDKCRRLIEFVFGPSKPRANTEVFKSVNKTAIDNVHAMHKENSVQKPGKADIDIEKQNNLLKDFLGADEDVLRTDYDNNLKLPTSVIEKHNLTQNKDNLDEDNTNARQSIDMTQSERNRDCKNNDPKWSSESGVDFDKKSSIDDCHHKKSNTPDTDIHDYIPAINYKLRATIAKNNEERLSKKKYVLDDTPRVDTSISRLEGPNIAQNILGETSSIFCNRTTKKSMSDVEGSLDNIANKCMNTPPSQVDNKLIQEIKKLEIPYKNEQKSAIYKNIVQMDTTQIQTEKPLHEVELDLDNREDKRQPVHCIEEDKIGPSFELPPHLDQSKACAIDETESFSYKKIETTKESETFANETNQTAPVVAIEQRIKNTIKYYDPKPRFDRNQPIIDPYDKKSLALDCSELDEAVMDSKLLDDQRIGKPSQNEENQDPAFIQSNISTSDTICPQHVKRVPMIVEDNMHLDHVQSVYDCAPREINWRPYPSFEAREEVMDFYSHDDSDLNSFTLNRTEKKFAMLSEPEIDHTYEPPPDHIYTSTSVSSETREQISHSFVQPEEMINPLMNKTINEPKFVVEQPENMESKLLESLEPPPSLNPVGNVSLTELLRRVRMRNRMEYCREFAIQTLNVHAPETLPEEGKCGKKTPPCPPPAPKCPPPSPCPPRPPASPPPPPPCPKPCKPPSKRPCPPPKKNPCNKAQKCSGTSAREVLTFLTKDNPLVKIPQKYLLPLLAYNMIRIQVPTKKEKEEILNENLVFRLSVLGKFLLFHYTESVDANLLRNRSELTFARDYEPWTPIPSWPIPKKEEKKRFVCPKEGCKVTPPPKLNAPCKENPCLNFPIRNNFSLTDLFSFSLVESLERNTV